MEVGLTTMANSVSSQHNSPICQPLTTLASLHFCKYIQGGLVSFGISWGLFAKTTIEFSESGMIHHKMVERELVNSICRVSPKMFGA